MSAKIILAKARLEASRRCPYLSSAILTMAPVEKPGIGTLGVSKDWRLYFDPAFMESHTIEMLAGVILHEVSHLVLKHHARCKALCDQDMTDLFNCAADFAVNDILREQGIRLPEGCLYPENFKLPKNLSAEQYYKLLLDEQAKGKPQEIPSPPIAGGSCSDGIRREWEDGNPEDDEIEQPEQQQSGDGEVESTATSTVPPVEQHVQDQILKEVADRISKYKGNLPGGMKRAAEEILHPKVDPRRLLMRAIQRHVSDLTAGNGRFSYRRPARRPSHGGTIRPRSFSPLPYIHVIIDTSGSMNKRDLSLCVGFVAKVLSGMRMRDGVHVIVGDAAVQGEMKIFDASKIELSGGGGTDMSLLIEHSSASKNKPGLIIVCTDGETGWPAKDVGIPTVACLTRQPGYYKVPKWIEQVVMG